MKSLDIISNDIYNFIRDYRSYSKWYFYDSEIKNASDVKKLLLKENGIEFMSDLSEMFFYYATEKDFSIPKDEEIYDNFCNLFKEYNKYLRTLQKDLKLDNLVWELVDFTKDYDPMQFEEYHKSEEVAFNHIYNDLTCKDTTENIKEWIEDYVRQIYNEKDITDKETSKELNRVNNLLKKVTIHYKTFEKDDLEL